MQSTDTDTTDNPDAPGPSRNGVNGRDPAGRFAPGNAGGPGNPHAKQVGALRSAMLRAISEEDMQEIVAKLVALARSGNVPAAKEVLDRCLGKVQEADLLERLDLLEGVLMPGQRR